MDLGLRGRTVIVTGGSGGIGRHVAAVYGAEQADVVLTYWKAAADAEAAAEAVRAAGGRALPVQYVLGDEDSARALIAAAIDWTGRIDVLVNNAVVTHSKPAFANPVFDETPHEEWLAALRDNVEGAVALSRLVAPVFRQAGWGRLVHMSSSIVSEGMAGGEYYAAAKSALHGLSRSLAFSLGAVGDILSVVVMFGLIPTVRNEPEVAAIGDWYAGRTAVRRLIGPEELARTVAFLGSAANTCITGEVVTASGGA